MWAIISDIGEIVAIFKNEEDAQIGLRGFKARGYEVKWLAPVEAQRFAGARWTPADVEVKVNGEVMGLAAYDPVNTMLADAFYAIHEKYGHDFHAKVQQNIITSISRGSVSGHFHIGENLVTFDVI